jgi:long-chain acyl-CoA synthetase
MAYQIRYGFYQGDVMKLKEDLMELKPTIMVSVPRLFNRFYDGMQSKIKELTGIKRTITEWGL